MEDIESPWCNWCRLCAKEDTGSEEKIYISGDYQLPSAGEDVQLTLKEALEKFFLVQSCEELFPQQLCSDCVSLISSVALFKGRVERVQQMYKFLLENPEYDSSDLNSVRIKFDVSEGNIKQWCICQNETRESVSEIDEKPTEICGADRFTVHIKEETFGSDSNLSEYDKNDDVDNEADQEDGRYTFDEVYFENDSQAEEEDPFETMSEDNSWSEEEEKISPKATNKRTSARKKKNIDSNTGGTSKVKKRRGKLGNNNRMKKKKATEDFVFYVACKECGQKFDLFSIYCEHMEKVHVKASAAKLCPICDRDLQTWYHLGRHMRVHMPLEYRKPIKCPECENRYTSSAQLDVHIKHKHRNEKPFICEVCGFRGGTKHSLQQHMFMHTENAPFECEVCKKKFKKRSRLNFHMDIHGPNKFVCTICGLQLNSRATLKNHLVVHSDELRHKCDYCGKGFKRSQYLKNHLLLHTGLKPYSCNFCQRTFSVRALCRMHMNKRHADKLASLEASGDKTYTSNIPRLETLKAMTKDVDKLRTIKRFGRGTVCCDFCDSKFTSLQNCRIHMKKKHPNEFSELQASGKITNTKKKPHKKIVIDWHDFGKTDVCDFCDRSFASRIYCRAHMRRNHLDELTVIAPSGNKTYNRNKTPQVVTKYSDCFRNELQTAETSKSPSDVTPCSSTTTTTNIQDYFVLID